MLKLENISKEYQGVKILENVNFEITFGTSVAIIGASGTGKTTLLNIASLLDVPSSGAVLYFGNKIKRENYTKTRKKYISFVYQQHNLMPEFTIFENIAIVAQIKGVYDKQFINETLKAVGLLEHANKKPSELSGGQKQRASIVRAIASKPEILFADEPTGNLDPESANITSDLIISLAKTQQIAVFLITHNMEIAKKCDIIYKVENKNLVKV